MSKSVSSPDPRRVLLVTYEYPPLGGGGGVIFRDLAEELARQIEVSVLTSGRRGLAERERVEGLDLIRTPVWMRNTDAVASLPSMLSFFPSSMRAGRRLLESARYDLVHSSFAVPSGPSGLLLARRFGLPHVLSAQGGDIYDPSKWLSPHHTPLLKQTVKWVIHGSDRVVASSSDTIQRMKSFYGAREIDLIPLAVKPIPFEPVPRSAFGLGLEPEHLVLITVGRLVARKGLDRLIEILGGLGEPRARLLVVGEGPQREELERCAREAGITDRIRFTGSVSEEKKWQLLAISDLYVSTTLHEGFGIVFLEAMESGLPVICFDRGGQTDFVTDEVGFLVPMGDSELFRERLLELLRNPELRQRQGEAARRLAKDYSVGRLAERYLASYRRCLNRDAS